MNFKDNDGCPVSMSEWVCFFGFWGEKSHKRNANEVRFHQVVLADWPTQEIEFANGKNKTSCRSSNSASWEHRVRSAELHSYQFFAPQKGWNWGLFWYPYQKKKLESQVLNLLFWWILTFPSPFFQYDISKMRMKNSKAVQCVSVDECTWVERRRSAGPSDLLRFIQTYERLLRNASTSYLNSSRRKDLAFHAFAHSQTQIPFPFQQQNKKKKPGKGTKKKPAAQAVNRWWKFHQTKRHQLPGLVHFWSIYTFLNLACSEKSRTGFCWRLVFPN